MKYKEYRECMLCPRNCRIDRNSNKGVCGEKTTVRIGRAAPHYWEEPCISGENGSGTVFFAGCNLKCIYCQNNALSSGEKGREITVDELIETYLRLQAEGVHNINLVTSEHFAPSIKDSILRAEEKGLEIPIILNSSGYVSVETLELLKDVIDVYLVDFKYMNKDLAKEFSGAPDYPEVAKRAIEQMVKYKSRVCYDKNGMITSGVVVRHLCLPGCTDDSKDIVKYIYETYSDSVVLSIMSQYTPMPACEKHPLLKRKLTAEEYDSVVDFCIDIGVEDAYIQEGEAASESFIPEFYGK